MRKRCEPRRQVTTFAFAKTYEWLCRPLARYIIMHSVSTTDCSMTGFVLLLHILNGAIPVLDSPMRPGSFQFIGAIVL